MVDVPPPPMIVPPPIPPPAAPPPFDELIQQSQWNLQQQEQHLHTLRQVPEANVSRNIPARLSVEAFSKANRVVGAVKVCPFCHDGNNKWARLCEAVCISDGRLSRRASTLQEQVTAAIALAMEQQIQKLLVETQLDITEFDSLLQPIIDTCTKDAISVRRC